MSCLSSSAAAEIRLIDRACALFGGARSCLPVYNSTIPNLGNRYICVIAVVPWAQMVLPRPPRQSEKLVHKTRVVIGPDEELRGSCSMFLLWCTGELSCFVGVSSFFLLDARFWFGFVCSLGQANAHRKRALRRARELCLP